MNDDELEILKSGAEGISAGELKSIHEIILKLAGPAAEEIGLSWRDQVRVWRLSRAIRLANRVRDLIPPGEVTATPVPLKLLLPSFEYASLEDDDYLQDRWAALLANSTGSNVIANRGTVFVELLKQLSTFDVMLLDSLWEEASGFETDLGNHGALEDEFFETVRGKHGIDDIDVDKFRLTIQNIVCLGIIRIVRRTMREGFLGSLRDDLEETMENHYHFSSLGYIFVASCQVAPAKPAS